MKNFSLLRLLLATLLCSSLLLAGCTNSQQTDGLSENGEGQTSDSSQENDNVVIGFSQVTLESPFYVSLVDAAKAEAEKQGVELIAIDAQNDIEKQNRDVQDLITKGIDVLVINPTHPTAVAPALQAAKQANIPVITVDRPTEEEVTAFIGRDNKEMGRIAAKKRLNCLAVKEKQKEKLLNCREMQEVK